MPPSDTTSSRMARVISATDVIGSTPVVSTSFSMPAKPRIFDSSAAAGFTFCFGKLKARELGDSCHRLGANDWGVVHCFARFLFFHDGVCASRKGGLPQCKWVKVFSNSVTYEQACSLRRASFMNGWRLLLDCLSFLGESLRFRIRP